MPTGNVGGEHISLFPPSRMAHPFGTCIEKFSRLAPGVNSKQATPSTGLLEFDCNVCDLTTYCHSVCVWRAIASRNSRSVGLYVSGNTGISSASATVLSGVESAIPLESERWLFTRNMFAN